jgi:spore coat assembly protein
MLFERGNLVTRKSYNNDVVFRIDDIIGDNAILSGTVMRLCADAKIDDLQMYEPTEKKEPKDDVPFTSKSDHGKSKTFKH